VKVVEDVLHTINRFPRPAGMKDGSEIRVEILKDRVGRMDVKRLARAMILLADPFGDDPEGFKPVLVAPEFADLEALVKKRYFEEGEYHLAAQVDRKGRARAAVLDWRGRELFAANHDELAVSRDKDPYECPPACLDLWVFLLNNMSFSARRVTLGEVRGWLQEFGGVHLYQNGLRVNPYGNPGNDWLDMNLRRAQSPEERPSTNTAIGRVRLEDTANVLVQKTDRSGIIEVPAFQELKAFATDAMEWMARRRLSIAEERRRKERSAAPKRSRRSKRRVDKAIEKLPEDHKAEVKEAFFGYQRDQEREVRQLRKEVQLYRTLSTAGITAATFAHESEGNPIKVISHSIGAVERRSRKLLGKSYDEALKRPVESVKRATASLAVLGIATLKLVDHEKRRLSRVDVHTVILEVLEMFKPFLEGRDVRIETRLASGNPFLRGSEAAIESIITNLLNNSLAALEGVTIKDRMIRVVTRIESSVLIIHVLDNGPGIEGINKKDIWLPGYTTRKNGTGLGLTIVRDSVIDLGGKVDAIEHGELGGAEVVIELPLLGE
jgi:signal transduction histidine kinase